MQQEDFIPYNSPNFSTEESDKRVQDLFNFTNKRRSVRMFSDKAVPRRLIENLIKIAASAPSGAHKQPWTFCVVSNPEIKAKIREAAEKEEFENYNGRMSKEWLEDLKKFKTNWQKEFLTIAPWLIVIFKKAYDLNKDGSRAKNYYVNESVGIAAGFLLNAIHHAGLVSLTHTPSPMNFLQKVLNRPENERPFLLIPVGYPTTDAEVPVLKRKSLEEMSIFYD